MRNPSLRRSVRVTVTLVGLTPPVWRELVVDRDLSLAELHDAVALAMDWPVEAHYVFADQHRSEQWDPAPWNGRSATRRWGDRWTMIDWRDPDVIEAHTVTIGRLLDDGPLFYGCDVAGLWWCRIDARGDDMELAIEATARLTTGSGRAPLPGGPGVDELPRMHEVLSDPVHPDHEELATLFRRLVGPWSSYAPSSTDLDGARRAVATRFGSPPARRRPGSPSSSARVRTRGDALADAVPPAARAGLRRRIDRIAADAPAAMDDEAIGATVRPFHWLVSTVGTEGTPLEDGFLPSSVAEEGAAQLGYDLPAMRELVVQGREMRLVRRWRGRLIMLVAAEPVRHSQLTLWNHLADGVWHRPHAGWWSPRRHDLALLLLAIADGSLSDPRHGEEDLDAALHLLDADASWHGDPFFGGDAHSPTRLPPSSQTTAVRKSPVDGIEGARTLAFLGLTRDDQAGWQTPPGLRSFAADALTRKAPPAGW